MKHKTDTHSVRVWGLGWVKPRTAGILVLLIILIGTFDYLAITGAFGR